MAYLALAERLPEVGFVGEASNFASDQPLSVLTLVQEILRATGRSDLEPVVMSEASAEIPEQSLDCSKAKEKLGWGSTWSLEDGLRDTVDWYAAWLDRQTRA